MTQSIEQAIIEVQTLAAAITGIKAAPPNFGEDIKAKPFTICYPSAGDFTPELLSGSGVAVLERHTITLEAHYNRQNLKPSMEATKEAIPLFIAKLSLNPTLNGAVDTIIYPITYSYGVLEFGTDVNLGFRLEIPIKIRTVYNA